MANGFDVSQKAINLWRTLLSDGTVTTKYDLIAIYGVGTSGAWLLRLLDSTGFNNSVFIEDDIRKVDFFFQGRPILTLEEFKKLSAKKIVLVSLDRTSTSKILKVLKREKIVVAYIDFVTMKIVLT